MKLVIGMVRKGHINFTVWSDVFICPYCSQEFVFWDAAVDQTTGNVEKIFKCPICKAQVGKTDLTRATKLIFDQMMKSELEQVKQVPVLINYSIGKKRYEKRPDPHDLSLIKSIFEKEIPYWYPSYPMMLKGGTEWGDQWRAGYHIGVTHSHHFYNKRILWILSSFYNKIISSTKQTVRAYLLLWFTSSLSERQ